MIRPAISILCPTRGRPGNVKQLIQSAVRTAADPSSLEFVFYFDDDDRSMSDVQWLEIEPLFLGAQWTGRVVHGRWSPPTEDIALWQAGQIKCLRGPRIVLSEYWNRCYEQAGADVLMQCGDDIIFRTEDWDRQVLQTFESIPDRIALVYGDDGLQHQKVATHGFLHRRWARCVGYFVPPYFASDYNDLWLTEVARKLDRLVYLPQVYTEHMHPAAGKGPLDKTHQERLNRHNRENCDKIWNDTADKRAVDVAKLRAYIEGYEFADREVRKLAAGRKRSSSGVNRT